MIVMSHEHSSYSNKRNKLRYGRHNGAYYYSVDIVKNIIPNVKTDRNWDTVGLFDSKCDRNHSIVFIHHNIDLNTYAWLKRYDDVVAICGTEKAYKEMKELGYATPIYLPLSVDVKEVKKHEKAKTKKVCHVGNIWSFKRNELAKLPEDVDFIHDLERGELLDKLAEYEECYAIGRCAIEAKILGCKILPFTKRFPDPSVWEVLDNKDAAKILQRELDKIK